MERFLAIIHNKNSELSEIDETKNDCEYDNLRFANNPEIEQSLSMPELETDPFIIPAVVQPSTSSGSDAYQNISTKRKKKQPNNDFEGE